MTTKNFNLCCLLGATTSIAIISTSVAALNRAVNDGDEPGRRPTRRVVLAGQVLLVNSGVATLRGSPPPPPIAAFAGSLRMYLSESNTFVTVVKADAQGKFAIALLPGRYRIVPDIMREEQVLAPGDAYFVIAGPYESASALEVYLAPNTRPNVTITYRRSMGN